MILTLKQLRLELAQLTDLDDAELLLEDQDGNLYRLTDIYEGDFEQNQEPIKTLLLGIEYQEPIADLSTMQTEGNA